MMTGLLRRGGEAFNPFAPSEDAQMMSNLMISIGISFIPTMFLSTMQVSKQWRAAWVFHAAPIDKVRVVKSVKRLVAAIIILPMGLVIFAIFTFLWGNPIHSLLHSIFLVSVGLLVLTFGSMYIIRLPFAMDQASGNLITSALGPFLVSMLIFAPPLAIISNIGYGGYLNWALAITLCLLIKYLLTKALDRRIRKKILEWEFTG
jgi:hypothetical protein